MPSLVTPIPIVLDKPRTLLLDNRAIFQCERELSRLWGEKVSLFQVLSDVTTLGLNDLSVMLWQACLAEDPSLTLSQVQHMMDLRRLPEMLTAVLDAWNAATLPAAPVQEVNGAADPLASASTGPGSGAMPVSTLA